MFNKRLHNELLNIPIRNIIDGWVLTDGRLYLIVREGNEIKTICIDRNRK